VLALSKDEIRLLEGTRYSVAEVELSGVPESLAEALAMDEPRRQQLRAVGKSSAGSIIQGYGESSDTAEKQLLRFFQRVDRGLRDLIADKQIPLVVAGVDYLLPIYRDANTYPHLVEQGLTGNPETLSARELHNRAWELVEPQFNQELEEQIALYHQLAGREDARASTSLKQILIGAHQGRVATLFVALHTRLWGNYYPDKPAVHVHPEMQPGDQDLLDLAAVQTFANGGQVFAIPQDDIPGDEPLVAIFRY
jgi:hypothetical protein